MKHNTKMLAASLLLSCLLVFSCKKERLDAEQESAYLKAGKPAVDLQVLAQNFTAPVYLTESPDGTGRLFVVDQTGQVWIIDKSGNRMSQPFIDISNKLVSLRSGYDERGLLGLAFHPNYQNNGKFYLFYTAPPPPGGPTVDAGNTGLPMTWDNMTTISEFSVSGSNPNMADPASERKLLEEPHPQFNHNGGTIAFGPDGYLYISIGDGGNKNDIGPGHVEDWYAFNAGGNGQDIEANLMGNVLRIDVNGMSNGMNYAIPVDNPYVGKPGKDEIWAYGFRNPYRFSFDMKGSQRMILSDAGQNRYEEIDVVTRGGNYGWNVKEGDECFNAADEFAEMDDCPSVDVYGNVLLDPVISPSNVANPEGGHFVVIVGGFVYRAHNVPGLQGKYLFANATASFAAPSGEVYISQPQDDPEESWSYSKLSFASYPDNTGHVIKGFGQDMDGQVYVLGTTVLGPTGTTGKVFKIVRAE